MHLGLNQGLTNDLSDSEHIIAIKRTSVMRQIVCYIQCIFSLCDPTTMTVLFRRSCIVSIHIFLLCSIYLNNNNCTIYMYIVLASACSLSSVCVCVCGGGGGGGGGGGSSYYASLI